MARKSERSAKRRQKTTLETRERSTRAPPCNEKQARRHQRRPHENKTPQARKAQLAHAISFAYFLDFSYWQLRLVVRKWSNGDLSHQLDKIGKENRTVRKRQYLWKKLTYQSGVGGLQDLTWLIWDPHSVFRDLDSLFRTLTWQRLTGRQEWRR
jgi:hypothetical protein